MTDTKEPTSLTDVMKLKVVEFKPKEEPKPKVTDEGGAPHEEIAKAFEELGTRVKTMPGVKGFVCFIYYTDDEGDDVTTVVGAGDFPIFELVGSMESLKKRLL